MALLSHLMFFCMMIVVVSSRGAIYTPPSVPHLTDRFNHVPINQGYSEFFGHSNIHLMSNGSIANLILDNSSDYSLVECQALVLPPTLELAQQSVKVHACVGGTSVREDQRILSSGVHVVVGTPGRVFDMLRRQSLRPVYIKMFVLDEADEMLSRGSGLVSRNKYNYGFFSAGIKLPSGFTSGVVIAFYLSNADLFPHNHDEIDIELLGHEKRREWVLQTNVYGNGSVHTGREEKLYLWFDPTQQFHQYSILWNTHHIVFLVDDVPVREFIHSAAISSVYPSKPMSVYATIWDASEWATHGGKYPVNYQYAPFVASFWEMEMEGCILQHPTADSAATSCSWRGFLSLDPVDGEEFAKLSQEQINGLEWARRKFMFYSYCKDTSRYKVLPPECHAN
ncbi:unnamed protein product [Camellia sinensis]